MNLRAYKMDGLGNDFVIFDNRKKITHLNKSEIIKRHICLPIWYRLEDSISDKAIKEIKESMGV